MPKIVKPLSKLFTTVTLFDDAGCNEADKDELTAILVKLLSTSATLNDKFVALSASIGVGALIIELKGGRFAGCSIDTAIKKLS